MRAATTAGSSLTHEWTQDEIDKRLFTVRCAHDNTFCADCDAKNPAWASSNIGAFICLDCAGVHRSLGVHISVVKSVSHDQWRHDMVTIMEKNGNHRVNALYEQYLAQWSTAPSSMGIPRKCTPSSTQPQRDAYIRAKYVTKQYTKPMTLSAEDEKKMKLEKKANKRQARNAMPTRLADFFMVFGRGAPTTERVGHKKYSGTIMDVVYQPQLLETYPRNDDDGSLPDNVGIFVFPDGVRLSDKAEDPTCFRFVSTKISGAKQYGVCLRWYEKMNPLEMVRLTQEVKGAEAKEHEREVARKKKADDDAKKKAQAAAERAAAASVVINDKSAIKFGTANNGTHHVNTALSPHSQAVVSSMVSLAAGITPAAATDNKTTTAVVPPAVGQHPPIPPKPVIFGASSSSAHPSHPPPPIPPKKDDTKTNGHATTTLTASATTATTPAPSTAPTPAAPAPTLAPLPVGGTMMRDRTLSYDNQIWYPRAIAIISHWPLLPWFEAWLKMLYRISLSSPPLPIERFIANFLHEVPVPPLGHTKVQISLGGQSLLMSRPPPNTLPLAAVDFKHLFRQLDHNNVLLAFAALAAERKIVLVSHRWSLLVNIAEALCSLLFPLYWQGVYMPLLPPRLNEFLYAPVPFIAGLHADHFDKLDQDNNEVVIINIDTNKVTCTGRETIPSLPERAKKKLLAQLKKFASIYDAASPIAYTADMAFPSQEHLVPITEFATLGGMTSIAGKISDDGSGISLAPGQGHIDNKLEKGFDVDEIRRAFLRFWVATLGSYRTFMIPDVDEKVAPLQPQASSSALGGSLAKAALATAAAAQAASIKRNKHDGKPEQLFNNEGFIKSCDDDERPLIKCILDTQMWSAFIDQRWTPSCKRNDATDAAEVRFFDDTIQAKINRGTSFSIGKSTKLPTPFIDDTSMVHTRTFVVPPPDTSGIPAGARYRYDVWPARLNDSLFGPTRYVKPLIAEENERRGHSARTQQVTEMILISPNVNRRDWHGTMDAVIKIQSAWRMHVAHKRYKRIRKIVIFLQRKLRAKHLMLVARSQWRLTKQAAIILQTVVRAHHGVMDRYEEQWACETLHSYMMTRLAMDTCRRKVRCIIWLQQHVRAMAQTRTYRREYQEKRKAIITIQAHIAMIQEQQRQREAVMAIQTLQAHIMAQLGTRRIRHIHSAVIFMQTRARLTAVARRIRYVTRIQALARGIVVRRAQYRATSLLLERLRWKIVNYWHDLNVPLIYRSKFWLVFEGVSFLNVGVHQDELARLEAMIKRGMSPSIGHGNDSKEAAVASHRSKKPSIVTDQSSEKQKNALAAERLLLKTTLKEARDGIKQSLFVHEMKFGIGEKKKKERLLASIWHTRAPDVTDSELKEILRSAAGAMANSAASHVDQYGRAVKSPATATGETKRAGGVSSSPATLANTHVTGSDEKTNGNGNGRRARGVSHAPPPRHLSVEYDAWTRSARLVLAIIGEHMSPLAEASTTTDLMQLKREQRIRKNLHFTVQSSLASLLTAQTVASELRLMVPRAHRRLQSHKHSSTSTPSSSSSPAQLATGAASADSSSSSSSLSLRTISFTKPSAGHHASSSSASSPGGHHSGDDALTARHLLARAAERRQRKLRLLRLAQTESARAHLTSATTAPTTAAASPLLSITSPPSSVPLSSPTSASIPVKR